MTDATTRRGSILYISHYFPPEVNAPAGRVYEMARVWARQGRRVKVLTGFPNHPHGTIPAEYRGKVFQRETLDGIEVYRCWMYAAPNTGLIRRMLNYLSFMVSAIVIGTCRTGRADCVIATSPQMFVAVAGWILSRIKRAPFIFEVRDLWPEEIATVGAIKNRLIIRCLEKLEMFLYRRAARIIALAQGTIEILTRRGVPTAKLALIPNGVDLTRFAPGRRHNHVRDRLNLNGDFLVSYIGTVGMAHRLDVFLEAAQLMKDTPHVKFLIVGDGAEKQRLCRAKVELGLDNLRLLEQQPREEIAAYYAASDCCLVHLKQAPLFEKNIPSKIFEIMASGKPVLLGTRGESKRLVARAGCGVFFEPENAADLVEGIRRLQHNPQWRKKLGRSGSEFVQKYYSRDDLARQYLAVLDTTMGLNDKPIPEQGIPAAKRLAERMTSSPARPARHQRRAQARPGRRSQPVGIT
jgi:glycosyltransferase involved in cell wall biosynthesis